MTRPAALRLKVLDPLSRLDRRRFVNGACLALAAWITILPYFTWSHRRAWLAASALLSLAVGMQPRVLGRSAALPLRDQWALAALCAFLIYATALPQVGGGYVAWIYILPFAATMILLDADDRRRVVRAFEVVVCASLLPGLLWLALLIAGVPLTVDLGLPPNATFAAQGVRLLRLPGAVFIESNSAFLPWGGLLSRLCGMFDEPGRVGTIAALLLATGGFDFRRVAPRVLYVAGLCSFSLAFIVLCGLGLIANIFLRRRLRQIWLLLALAPVALLALGVVRLPRAMAEPANAISIRGESRPVRPIALRQTQTVNNRALPEMQRLYDRYRMSPWPVLLIGLGSDSSLVYGRGVTVSLKSWLTNYGALGAALLAAIFLGYGVASLAAAHWALTPVLFLGLFLLSAYQQPVIWLPYELVVFFGGLAHPATAEPPEGQQDPEGDDSLAG